MEILPGNATDASPALALSEESEQNVGLEVAETVDDYSFGDGNTRQEFADAERQLVAKVIDHGRNGQIHKSEFRIDLEAMTCSCPAGHTGHPDPDRVLVGQAGAKAPRAVFRLSS